MRRKQIAKIAARALARRGAAMTAPTTCVLCAVLHDRERRAIQPAAGLALCVECRRSCDRGDGDAEAARRRANAKPPDAGAATMMRLGTLHSLGVVRAAP